MKKINEVIEKMGELPIELVQFGEGNFLRAFVDYMVDKANSAGISRCGIAVIKPIKAGSLQAFKEQDCAFTVLLRGMLGGERYEEGRVVSCVQKALCAYDDYEQYMELARLDTLRYVVSNTTEAGIAFDAADRLEHKPPNSFPAKLTQFLYERYVHFKGSPESGLCILPCELIDNNGSKLKEYVLEYASLWGLEKGFSGWLLNHNVFANTLVDRIVSGFPRDEAERLWEEFGYRDDLLDCAEPHLLWVIGDTSLRPLPFEGGLDGKHMRVVYTQEPEKYRELKVRILNGAHTAIALAGIQMGMSTVLGCVNDKLMGGFLSKALDEIVPTLSLPVDEVQAFEAQVMERFSNPYIRHELKSIALNSISKWKVRLMPSALGYIEKVGSIPKHLAFSLAALMKYYELNETQEPGALDELLGELAEHAEFMKNVKAQKAAIDGHGVRGAMERL